MMSFFMVRGTLLLIARIEIRCSRYVDRYDIGISHLSFGGRIDVLAIYTGDISPFFYEGCQR